MNHPLKENHPLYHASSQLMTTFDIPAVFKRARITALEEENVTMQDPLSNAVPDPNPIPHHSPVLVREVIANLVYKPHDKAVYLDCTVGMGGHANAILQATLPACTVIGIDRDQEAIAFAGLKLNPFQDRIKLVHGSFKRIGEIAGNLGLSEVNGILVDCGVSSMQLTSLERGFSCTMSGPLDMRMDRSLSQTAADIVNTLREEDLANLIYRYGEEKASRRIAAAIVRYRENEEPIIRTDCLSEIVCRVVYRRLKGKRIHPATKTFQALRIAVNDELGELEGGLARAISLLAVGGRLAVISFHSLEDRIVKQSFRAAARPSASTATRGSGPLAAPRWGRFVNLYKKPIIPTDEEIAQNGRARSAKMRVLERVE